MKKTIRKILAVCVISLPIIALPVKWHEGWSASAQVLAIYYLGAALIVYALGRLAYILRRRTRDKHRERAGITGPRGALTDW